MTFNRSTGPAVVPNGPPYSDCVWQALIPPFNLPVLMTPYTYFPGGGFGDFTQWQLLLGGTDLGAVYRMPAASVACCGPNTFSLAFVIQNSIACPACCGAPASLTVNPVTPCACGCSFCAGVTSNPVLVATFLNGTGALAALNGLSCNLNRTDDPNHVPFVISNPGWQGGLSATLSGKTLPINLLLECFGDNGTTLKMWCTWIGQPKVLPTYSSVNCTPLVMTFTKIRPMGKCDFGPDATVDVIITTPR